MTEEQIRQAVIDGIKVAFSNPDFHCRYNISPNLHQQQHEALNRFIIFVGKVDDVKWAVIKKLVLYLVVGGFSIFMWGLAVKAGIVSAFKP